MFLSGLENRFQPQGVEMAGTQYFSLTAESKMKRTQKMSQLSRTTLKSKKG